MFDKMLINLIKNNRLAVKLSADLSTAILTEWQQKPRTSIEIKKTIVLKNSFVLSAIWHVSSNIS